MCRRRRSCFLSFPTSSFTLHSGRCSPDFLPYHYLHFLFLLSPERYAVCELECVLSRFRRVRLSVTPWTVALQAALSTGLSRNGLPCPAPGDFLNSSEQPLTVGTLSCWTEVSFLPCPGRARAVAVYISVLAPRPSHTCSPSAVTHTGPPRGGGRSREGSRPLPFRAPVLRAASRSP